MPVSLRARAAIGAVLLVGIALLAGSVAMVLLTRSSLTANVREAAELRAEDVATALASGATSTADLAVEDQEDAFIQVVDTTGQVVASSANVDGFAAVAALADEESTVIGHAPVGQDRFVVVGIAVADRSQTVLVGRALDGADEATRALLSSLGIGVPLLLVLVGLVAWRLVGRALAPVAAMTAGAREITATDIDRRLPEPDTADEIGDLARTLNAMLDRLGDSRDRLAAFVADAAHELRSPVSSLRQHAEVTLEHPEASSVEELAVVVADESLRLQRLVDDLLLLARADDDVTPVDRGDVDLDDVVGTVVGRRRATDGITVDLSAVSGGQVRGDPVGLDRLVANLLDNATLHARNRVAIALQEADDGTVTLTVDDDGPGIPEPDRRRVFERFVRLDEARSRDAGGSGLGLAIVAAVAAGHNASVTVTDAPGGGARFRVAFPPPPPAPGTQSQASAWTV
jgi:signal transduction histidine kinase